LAVGVLALACLPVLALLPRPLNPYPVYKLTLTCGPLLTVALGMLVPRLRLPLLLAAATGTVLMEDESARHRPSPFAHVRSMQEDDFGWAEGRLEGLEPGDVLLAVEPYSHATWLSYRGRQHRIWLLGDLDNLIPRPVPPPDGPPVYLLVEET